MMESPDKKNIPPVTLAVCGTVMFSPAIPISRFQHCISGDILERIRSADISVCDLETVLTARTDILPKASPVIAAPSYASAVASWGFSHANCVHNHTLDAGRAGFDDTIAALRNAGVMPLTGGPHLSGTPFEVVTRQGRRIALLNYSAIGEIAAQYDAFASALADIARARAEADHVIVFYHDGVDLASIPLPSQQERYRAMVRAGADAVFTNQAHIVQGFERLEGGLIFHNVGNFVVADLTDTRFGPIDHGIVIELRLGCTVECSVTPVVIGPDLSVRMLDWPRQAFQRRLEEWSVRYSSIHYSRWEELKTMGVIAPPILKVMWHSGLRVILRNLGLVRMLRTVWRMMNRYYAGLCGGLVLRSVGVKSRVYVLGEWLMTGEVK